jgi:hypothetical protein
VWTGTGILEIALSKQLLIKDRLSIGFFDAAAALVQLNFLKKFFLNIIQP